MHIAEGIKKYNNGLMKESEYGEFAEALKILANSEQYQAIKTIIEFELDTIYSSINAKSDNNNDARLLGSIRGVRAVPEYIKGVLNYLNDLEVAKKQEKLEEKNLRANNSLYEAVEPSTTGDIIM